MSRTDDNLRTAFASECQSNIEYLAYAHQAMDEGLMQVAQLFREASGAEVVHALNHLKAMGVVRTTLQNLEDAVEGEDLEIKSIYPKFIREAEEEARHDAVDSFKIVYEREKHHRAMFRQVLRQLDS